MLFMAIERFKDERPGPVGERFRRSGRMMPEGVTYHGSWLDERAMRCFQIMEAASAELLQEWVRKWEDLVEFEIVEVKSAGEFWAQHGG
jgi:hypothetical protein